MNDTKLTPTEWSTIEDKQQFINQFKKFVLSDFSDSEFPKWFYKRLSMCFGFIAHYNQAGFYDTYFTCATDISVFLLAVMKYPCYGDPAYTYSDAEKIIQKWLKTEYFCYE